MASLSVIAELFKREQNKKHDGSRPGPRASARQPSGKQLARGALGSSGARVLQDRDSQSGEKKELETLNSPIFRAFIGEMIPKTPVTDWLNGAR